MLWITLAKNIIHTIWNFILRLKSHENSAFVTLVVSLKIERARFHLHALNFI